MSLATKIAAGLCICPVVAAPPMLMHKPTRDKIARAAGYVPKATKPVTAPVAVNPEVACVEPTPAAPVVSMGDLGRTPLALNGLPQGLPGGTGGTPFDQPGPVTNPPGRSPPPGGDTPGGGGGVIPGVPEPATWTVMVVGFGMVGAAMRRGNRQSQPQAGIKTGA